MKSTIKMMFAALFASAAHFGITEDSAGGAAAVAADPEQPVSLGLNPTGKINQYFESGDKRHLQEALLMLADENNALKHRLSELEDSLGVH